VGVLMFELLIGFSIMYFGFLLYIGLGDKE